MYLVFLLFFPDVQNQNSANYGPWAKSGPSLVFSEKDLLEHSHLPLFMYCLWLLLCYNGSGEQLPHKLCGHKCKNIYYLALCRKHLLIPAPDQCFPTFFLAFPQEAL